MYSVIRKSFKRELLVCFILVALLPLTISSSFLVQIFKTKLSRDYERHALQQMEAVETALNGFFAAIDELQQELLHNRELLNGITEEDSWLQNRAYMQLYAKTESYRDYVQFDIYNTEGVCLLSTSDTRVMEDLPSYWGILKVSRIHPEEMIIRNAYRRWNTETTSLQMARAVMEDEECIGFLVATIEAADFEILLENIYDEQNGIAILDQFWEEVYSTKTAKEEGLAELLRKRRMSDELIKQRNDKINFYIDEIGESGLFLVLGREAVFTEDITRTMVGVILAIAVLCMFLCLIVANIMSAYLTAPIKELNGVMHQVENGDLNVRVRSERRDELGELSANFDEMTGKLKEYMELQVRQQQELNDSNVAMMQAQLNPHFLYNTLDTMKWVAKANHVPELVTLSSSLAKILRMSISEKKFVTLAEEIQFVNYYTDIQKIRFNESFSIDIELPMELEDCIVPKLIIQPVVENAIIHGLREQEKGHVFVNVYEEKGRLCIEVTDDGCGMSEEMLRLLNSRDRERLKGHIGLYNVDTIIRLHYGEEYGVQAEVLREGGTKVLLTLPAEREELDV